MSEVVWAVDEVASCNDAPEALSNRSRSSKIQSKRSSFTASGTAEISADSTPVDDQIDHRRRISKAEKPPAPVLESHQHDKMPLCFGQMDFARLVGDEGEDVPWSQWHQFDEQPVQVVST